MIIYVITCCFCSGSCDAAPTGHSDSGPCLFVNLETAVGQLAETGTGHGWHSTCNRAVCTQEGNSRRRVQTIFRCHTREGRDQSVLERVL